MAQLASCPSCRRELRVPDALVGLAVRCPECATVFTAAADGSPGVVVTPAPQPLTGGTKGADDISAPSPISEAPERGEHVVDFDRPLRRYRRRDVEPHRGTTILVLGILSLVGILLCLIVPLVLGPIAWVLGNTDIKKIRAGTMDPAGEGNTNAGRICGIVATILGLVWLAFTIVVVAAVLLMSATVAPPAPAPAPVPRAPLPPRQPGRPNPQFPPRPPFQNDDFEESPSRRGPVPGSSQF